jgi:prevent-host-death family protein
VSEPAQYTIHEAKTQLSRLVARAERGEEVVLSRSGEPVAKIVAFRPRRPKRKPGIWRGMGTVADDFDELPDEILASFYGEDA